MGEKSYSQDLLVELISKRYRESGLYSGSIPLRARGVFVDNLDGAGAVRRIVDN